MYNCKICDISCPAEYQWKQHIEGKLHQSKLQIAKPNLNNPKCKCGKLCYEQVVKKEGPNKGRIFFSCPSQICKFFEWKDLKFKKETGKEQKEYILKRETQRRPLVLIPDICTKVKLYLDDVLKIKNDEIQLKIEYNLLDTFKQSVPIRRWDIDKKKWICPLDSLPIVLNFFRSIAVDVEIDKDILKTEKEIQEKPQLQQIKLIFDPSDYRTFLCSFEFNSEIINTIKILNPTTRSYLVNEKSWVIKTLELAFLIEVLEGIGFKSDIKESDVQNLVELALKQPEKKEIDLTLEDDEPVEKKKKMKLECDECKKPIFPGKNHICRFYGYYKCKCGHEWTSGYSWKGESQHCKVCDQEIFAYKTAILQKKEVTSGDKPHESSLCSMCQRLGRPCRDYSLFV